MARVTPLDWKRLVKLFEKYGCQYKKKKGSHHILFYPGAKRPVVIPDYKEIDVEVIKNNMLAVNMSRESYFELLKHLWLFLYSKLS